MANQAVVIVDPQQRFTLDGAPFEVLDAAAIVGGIESLNEVARDHGVPVLWLTRSIREQVGPGKRTKATYDISNFLGKWAEIDYRLTVADTDIHIEKPRHSGFYGTDLEIVLRQLDIDEILIAGFTINVCCLATAVDAVARDFGALLLTDLAGARGAGTEDDPIPAEEMHRMTCKLFDYGLGGTTTSAEVLRSWESD